MTAKKYRVKLATGEQQELKALVSRGRAAACRQTHARILLLSDEAQGDRAMKDEEIARSLRIGCAMVERVRRRCSEPPQGRVSWTLKLLADRLVECEIVEASALKRCARRSKRRTQALAEGVLVHPAPRQR